MSLPKLKTPIFELDLPLSKKTISFRPFLVKEEKLLLMAAESEDEKTILSTIKQIVNNCIISKFDIDIIPLADLEFIFINLRARSVGETIDLQYKCNNMIGDSVCGTLIKYKINILDIKITEEIPNNIIQLDDKIGIKFNFPTVNVYDSLNPKNSNLDILDDMIISCLDYIYDEDVLYYAKDSSKEELKDFINELTQQQFDKIEAFFKNIPKLKTELEFKCPKCGYTETIKVEGIQNFFS